MSKTSSVTALFRSPQNRAHLTRSVSQLSGTPEGGCWGVQRWMDLIESAKPQTFTLHDFCGDQARYSAAVRQQVREMNAFVVQNAVPEARGEVATQRDWELKVTNHVSADGSGGWSLAQRPTMSQAASNPDDLLGPIAAQWNLSAAQTNIPPALVKRMMKSGPAPGYFY